LKKSSLGWIWQHDKRTDDYEIILNCVRKLMKNTSEKDSGKGPKLKKLTKMSIAPPPQMSTRYFGAFYVWVDFLLG
jgi:hypothetical protein